VLEQDGPAPAVVEDEQTAVVGIAAGLEQAGHDQDHQAQVGQRPEPPAQFSQQFRPAGIVAQRPARRRPDHQHQQRQPADPDDRRQQGEEVANGEG